MELTALLPWWAGVLLALGSYVVLHGLAAPQELAPPSGVGDVGATVTANLVRTLALIGQYLLPLVFLFGALASFVSRRRSRTLLAETKGMEAVRGLSWQDFERLIGETFRVQGFTVRERGGKGADGGVDLVLEKDGERYLVQCKHWRSVKVGVPAVRELFGVMTAEGAAGGYLVTSGKVTRPGKDFAKGRNITVVEGPELSRMLSSAPRAEEARPAETSPMCPKCGGGMVLRTAKKGAHAGSQFWGCTRFPECRGTRGAGSRL